jgi:hypothetical protein
LVFKSGNYFGVVVGVGRDYYSLFLSYNSSVTCAVKLERR